MLSLELITDAQDFLLGRVRRTPLEESPVLSDLCGAPVWLKLENLQLSGSFKLRGALYKLSGLDEKTRQHGIASCSAGNHGMGLAWAGRALSVPVTVYVPRTIDHVKYQGIQALGARVMKSEYDGYDDTESWARQHAESQDLPFISAFDDYEIMAGNGGSLAAEVLEDLPKARSFVLPIGGGGLGAGFSFYMSKKVPQATFIGCQHQDSPGYARSLEQGEPITRMEPITTVAGGLEGGIGGLTYEILKHRVTEVALMDENEIISGMRWLLAKHRYLVEPSGAVTVAAALAGKLPKLHGPIVFVLSGRNVAYGTIQRIIGQ